MTKEIRSSKPKPCSFAIQERGIYAASPDDSPASSRTNPTRYLVPAVKRHKCRAPMPSNCIVTDKCRAPAGCAESGILPSLGGRLSLVLCRVFVLFLAILLVAGSASAVAQPAGTLSTPAFNPEAATRAYLARIPAEKKARSDAYFEGGYWLQLWQFLYGAGIAFLLLQSGLSARMRNFACRGTRLKPLQTAIYAIQLIALLAILSFPLTVYSEFFREHNYGLANQNFGGWFGDWVKGLLVSLVLGSLLMMALFGIVRRLERTWPLWGSVVTVAFLMFMAVIGPVFIAPLFNKYTPLSDPKIVEPILRMAHANGIATDKVFEMDASKQTKRISANVSGFLGTMRITLNDNLLQRCSLPEIEAVMAHELGHYVLNHVFKMLVFSGLIIVVGFAFLRWAMTRLLAKFGARWGITGVGDVAVTPLVMLLFSAYLFVLTPVTNSLVRMHESEADMFGLNAARQPDGFAEAALKLGEYRKMEPGPLEEWVFFDHPSGATRIRAAMRWKAENPGSAPGALTDPKSE